MRGRNNNRDNQGMQIPTVIGNQVLGPREMRPVTFSGKEVVAQLTVVPSTMPQGMGAIPFNPQLLLSAERLLSMSGLYTQFKFQRLRLTIATNLATLTSGNIVAGYSKNPDYAPALDTFYEAVSALENSISANMWQNIVMDCPCKIDKWLNVDINSSELMNTTQGVVYFAQNGNNLTAPYTFPVYLEYQVEFRGQQRPEQVFTGTVYTWPACVASNPSDEYGQIKLEVAPGETIGFPTISSPIGKAFICEPGFILPTGSSVPGQEEALLNVFVQTTSTPTFVFYRTIQDFEQEQQFVNTAASGESTTGRQTIEFFNPESTISYAQRNDVATRVVVKDLKSLLKLNEAKAQAQSLINAQVHMGGKPFIWKNLSFGPNLERQ